MVLIVLNDHVHLAALLVSCNNDKIEVYRIPKEGINVAMQSGSAGLVPPRRAIRPSGPNQTAGVSNLFLKCGLEASRSMARMPLRRMFQ